jgi:hypothetical protein
MRIEAAASTGAGLSVPTRSFLQTSTDPPHCERPCVGALDGGPVDRADDPDSLIRQAAPFSAKLHPLADLLVELQDDPTVTAIHTGGGAPTPCRHGSGDHSLEGGIHDEAADGWVPAPAEGDDLHPGLLGAYVGDRGRVPGPLQIEIDGWGSGDGISPLVSVEHACPAEGTGAQLKVLRIDFNQREPFSGNLRRRHRVRGVMGEP